MLIRRERPRDLDAVREVHRQAFPTPEGASTPAEVTLVDELRHDHALVEECCLVAEVDGEVIGHVVLSVGCVDGTPRLAGLGPIGVLPSHQGRGIGTALMHAAVAAADARDIEGIVLLGHESFYPRFGFEPAREHGILPPDEAWPDANFLLRRLHAWEDVHAPRGTFHYADAFSRL